MKRKSGLHCMIPSLLIIAAVMFTLNTGFPSPEALAAGNTVSAAVKQPTAKTATKTLKIQTAGKVPVLTRQRAIFPYAPTAHTTAAPEATPATSRSKW